MAIGHRDGSWNWSWIWAKERHTIVFVVLLCFLIAFWWWGPIDWCSALTTHVGCPTTAVSLTPHASSLSSKPISIECQRWWSKLESNHATCLISHDWTLQHQSFAAIPSNSPGKSCTNTLPNCIWTSPTNSVVQSIPFSAICISLSSLEMLRYLRWLCILWSNDQRLRIFGRKECGWFWWATDSLCKISPLSLRLWYSERRRCWAYFLWLTLANQSSRNRPAKPPHSTSQSPSNAGN